MAQRIVIPPINQAQAPPPPKWLPDECADEWTELWRAGIATRWRRGDWDVVGRLALLRVQFQQNAGMNVDSLARVHVQIHKLEQALLITPESQYRAGIVVEEPKVVTTDRVAQRAALEARLAEAGN